MKNKIFKYLLRGIGILIAVFVVSLISYKVFIFSGEVREDCAYEALNYVISKEENNNFYTPQERDMDYEFMYQFCLNKNGLKGNK